MGSLRSLRSVLPSPVLSHDSGCLDTFEREVDYLYGTLHRLGAPPADREDLLQEIFEILSRSWPTLDVTRPLRPWLFAVAFRVVRSHRRRGTRESCHEDLDPQDPRPSAEIWLQRHESMTLLSAALEQLPATRRSVVEMHELEGLEVVEIARRLSMTKFGVYARLHKARKELRAAVRRLLNGGRI